MIKLLRLFLIFQIILVSCSSVPRPETENMGIFILKVIFPKISKKTTNKVIYYENIKDSLQIAVLNYNEDKSYSFNCPSPGRVYSLYNLPAGKYKIDRISYELSVDVYGKLEKKKLETVTMKIIIKNTDNNLVLPRFIIKPKKILLYGAIEMGFTPDMFLKSDYEEDMINYLKILCMNDEIFKEDVFLSYINNTNDLIYSSQEYINDNQIKDYWPGVEVEIFRN